MKKPALPLCLAALALASCGGNGGASSSSSEGETPSLPSSSLSSSSEPEEDLSLLAEAPEEERGTYDNHFAEDSRLPGVSGSQCADPFVLRHDGRYYLYATSGGANLTCWESDDLLNWTLAGNALGVSDGSLQSPWAPEVAYINGRFYLISSFRGQRHSVLVSDSPTGPFVKHSEPFYNYCIDGSFFIDSDESVYCTIASSSGILVKRFNDDLTGFKNDRFEITYKNTKVGRWNEGPYISKRSGRYYLTYTGVDCYAPSYRVNYNYYDGESLEGIFDAGAFAQQGGSILLSTDENYMGLGHSANFVGPDLDSLYIAYHDLSLQYGSNGSAAGNRRYFNFARLSFNGSRMASDAGNSRQGLFLPRQPDFASRGGEGMEASGDFLLSQESHGESFTAEWNAVGEGGAYVFGYRGANDYGYLTANNENGLSVHLVEGGKDRLVASASLNKEYDFTKLHTYRLSYDGGRFNLYFDDIEKLSLEEAELPEGRYGYRGKGEGEVSYSAFSNAGLGTSDSLEFQKDQSLANAYDREASILEAGSTIEPYEPEETEGLSDNDVGLLSLKAGDRASYRFHADATSLSLAIKVSPEMAGRSFAIRINDGEKIACRVPSSLPDSGLSLISIGNVDVREGANYVSVYAEEGDFAFSEITYGEATAEEGYRFESGLRAYNASLTYVDHGRDRIAYTEDGMRSKGIDSDFIYVKDAAPLSDVKATAMVAVNEEVHDKMADRRAALGSLTMDAIDLDLAYGAGVAIRVKNHEYYHGGPNYEAVIDNLQGLYLGINSEKVFLKDCDYSFTETVFEKEHSFPLGEKHELTLESQGGEVKAYLDGELLVTYRSPRAPTAGKAGLYSFFTDATFSDFVLEAL